MAPTYSRTVCLQRAGADVERRAGGVHVVDEQRDPRRRRGGDRREAARRCGARAPRADLPPRPVRRAAGTARAAQPGRAASPAASSAAGSNPRAPATAAVRDGTAHQLAVRARRRSGAGAGRAAGWRPCARPSGPPAASAPRNFSAPTRSRAGALVGQRRPARSNAAAAAGQPAAVARERAARAAVAAQPGQRGGGRRRTPARRVGARQAAHDGGATARRRRREVVHGGDGGGRRRARGRASRASCAGTARERHTPVPCLSTLRGPSPPACSSPSPATPSSTACAGGPSRAEGGARAAGGWRAAAWGGGIACLFVALISPLDRLGEQMATSTWSSTCCSPTSRRSCSRSR